MAGAVGRSAGERVEVRDSAIHGHHVHHTLVVDPARPRRSIEQSVGRLYWRRVGKLPLGVSEKRIESRRRSVERHPEDRAATGISILVRRAVQCPVAGLQKPGRAPVTDARRASAREYMCVGIQPGRRQPKDPAAVVPPRKDAVQAAIARLDDAERGVQMRLSE